MRRKIIFFDLDGTLADSMAHIETLIVSMAVEDLGIPEDVIRGKLSHLLSLPASQAMPELAALAGKDVAVLSELMQRRPDITGQPLVLFPEVREVLAGLAASGYTLVLTTNTPAQGLDERLEAAGILQDFRIVLGTDLAAGTAKGPEHIRLAAAELGLGTKDLASVAIMVGDQEGDMRLAKQFGMPAIGRAKAGSRDKLTAAGAGYLIAGLTELADVLTAIDEASPK